MSIQTVTVYCSSSTTVGPAYIDAARELGSAIASAGWTLVYGGNRIGCMGALADAARARGGKVIGITPRVLMEMGHGDDHCHELVVTDDIARRKALMEEKADAFLVLPGGLGTLEELFCTTVSRFFHCHAKPIVLLNIAGFYNPLLDMMLRQVESGFVRPRAAELWQVAPDVPTAIAILRDGRSATS